MFIENPEAFKTWLTSILEPLCDADPAALAKYVHALVKKEKPPEELRDGLLDQLDVFLQHETKPFVDLLFKALENHDYLGEVGGTSGDAPTAGAGTVPTAAAAAVPVSAAHQSPATVIATILPSTQETNSLHPRVSAPAPLKQNNRVVLSRSTAASVVPSTANGTVSTATSMLTTNASITSTTTTATTTTTVSAPIRTNRQHAYTEQTLVKVVPDLLEQATAEATANQSRFKRDRDRRRRSRSRSWERMANANRRERPADRERDRGAPNAGRRAWRNRSPPPATAEYRRRGSGTSRSPSPAAGAGAGAAAAAGGGAGTEAQAGRQRSRSPLPRPPRAPRSPPASRPRSPRPRSPRSPRRRTDRTRKRCRDFDEKGYCMRGDLCSWDHGADPVVVEDAALSSVLALQEYNPLAPDIWREPPPPGYGAPPPPLPHLLFPPGAAYPVAGMPPAGGAAAGGVAGAGGPPRSLVAIPRAPDGPRPPPPPPAHPPPAHLHPPPPLHPAHPRQPHPHQPHLHQPHQPHQRWKQRRGFDYNRPQPTKPPMNCSLVLRRIPPGLNDITHLNNHLSKFGKIVNMQVNFEGDHESALVTFSNHVEANTAYKSTEAVLNNRFIMVFWHNNSNEEKNEVPGPAGTAPEVPGTEGASETADKNKPGVSSATTTATGTATTTSSAFTPLNNTHNKVLVNKENLSKMSTNISGPAGAANKRRLAATVRARGQQLLHRQLQHQRQLIQRLESSKVSGPAREALLSAVKAAQDGIEKLRKELLSTGNTAAVPAVTPLTQEGNEDIAEIQRRMVELRRLQHQTEQQHRRRFGRIARGGGSSSVNRGGAGGTSKSVDHRPRTLLVTGLSSDEAQALGNALTPIGALTTTTGGPDGNSNGTSNAVNLVASFARRLSAEHALGRIKNQYTHANVTWLQQSGARKQSEAVSEEPVSTTNGASTSETVVLNGKASQEATNEHKLMEDDDGADVALEDEEALLMGTAATSLGAADEEEDAEEEEEVRSWRR